MLTFTQSLPTSIHQRSGTPINKPKVLVVGKAAIQQTVLQQICTNLNMEYITFISAEDSLLFRGLNEVACIVTDFFLPGRDGLALQRELCLKGDRIPFIFASERPTISLAVQAMRKGALTVLDGTESESEIHAIVSKAIRFREQLKQQNAQQLDSREKLSRLTAKENNVLQRVLAGEKNTIIAKQLGMGLRTVEAHRHNVHKKTETNSLPALVRMVVQSEIAEAEC